MPADNDNAKIPGLFMNDKLYILGARLTSSYDKFDESLSFDMFGHAVGSGSNSLRGLSSVPSGSQFNYKMASSLSLSCQVHKTDGTTEKVKMEYVPAQSIDANTINVQLIWRCDISTFLSRSDLIVSQQAHVRVSVFSEENRYYRNSTIPIMTLDVPLHTQTVGRGGAIVKSNRQPSFLEQIAREGPMGVVLCVAGLSKGAMWQMPEFIQHHLNVGVEQIFLGIDLLDDLTYFQERLGHYIDAGVVVLGTDHIVQKGTGRKRDIPSREVRKMRLYNQCLYHAKGMSEFLAIWDIDELWIPPTNIYTYSNESTTNHRGSKHNRGRKFQVAKHLAKDELWRQSPYHEAMSLPQAARSLRGKDGCVDWCYQTFPSYNIIRAEKKQENSSDIELQGYFGFPVREAEVNFRWQKPIIRTKYAYQASFHVGGSCRRPEMPTRRQDDRDQDARSYGTMFRDCPLLTEPNDAVGSMHHYYNMFRDEHGVESIKEYPNVDEYTEFLRPTTLKQLKQLQDNVRAEDPGWLGRQARQKEKQERNINIKQQ